MPLDLPHLASTPITEITEGDLTWATTYESPLPVPMTVLEMPILQHPQPQLAQASSGITLLSYTAPTSQPRAPAPPTTEPLPPRQSTSRSEGLPPFGINPSTTDSQHQSLYDLSRNPSPAPVPSTPIGAITGRMSRSSLRRPDVAPEPLAQPLGNNSPDDSKSSHDHHRSYSRPLSRDMSISPTRQAARAPSTSFHVPQCHSLTRLPTPTEYPNLPSRPPSRRSCQMTPILPAMTLSDAIRFYQRTATVLSVAIPVELKQAEYRELYNYFAYGLSFIHAWGETQAGNDYFMKKQRGFPADDILQYEAERNARLLFNEVHRNVPMEELAPYEDIVAEADIQMPMPDEPPVPPPVHQSPISPIPGDTNHLGCTQAATDHSQVRAHKEAVAGNLLNHHNLLPHLSDGHYHVIPPP